jgi:hypothetical protein
MSRDALPKRLAKIRDERFAALAERVERLPIALAHRRVPAVGAIAFTLLAVSCEHKPLTRSADSGSGAAADLREAASEPDAKAACSTPMRLAQEDQVRAAAAVAAPCFSGFVGVSNGKVVAGKWGLGPYAAQVCMDAREDRWASQVGAAVAALDTSCFCYSENALEICLALSVSGGVGTQILQISSALADCGGPSQSNEPFQITLDESGQLVGTTGLSVEVSDCLVRALAGLAFPCLAGAGVCGEIAARP